jgi:hypothetical protein
MLERARYWGIGRMTIIMSPSGGGRRPASPPTGLELGSPGSSNGNGTIGLYAQIGIENRLFHLCNRTISLGSISCPREGNPVGVSRSSQPGSYVRPDTGQGAIPQLFAHHLKMRLVFLITGWIPRQSITGPELGLDQSTEGANPQDIDPQDFSLLVLVQ